MSLNIVTRGEPAGATGSVAGVVLSLVFTGILGWLDCPSVLAGNNNALVVDLTTSPTQFPGGANAMRLVNLETGARLASAVIGVNPDVALSPDGTTVAVVSRFVVDGIREPTDRIQLFRTADLSEISWGYLPFYDRLLGQLTAGFGVIAFADHDRVLLIPRRYSQPDEPQLAGRRVRWTAIDVEVLRQPLGESGTPRVVPFSAFPDVIGGNGARVVFLSTERWPLVLVPSRNIEPRTGQAVDTVQWLDFGQGVAIAERQLSPPGPVTRPGQGPLFSRGRLLAARGGRDVYVLPQARFVAPAVIRRDTDNSPGPLCHISLSNDQPVIRRQGREAASDLDPKYADLSESAQAIVVACDHFYPATDPPRRFRVYDMRTLDSRGEIDTRMEFAKLAFSHDGSEIYVGEAGRGSGRIRVYRSSDLTMIRELENMFLQLAVFVPLPAVAALGP